MSVRRLPEKGITHGRGYMRLNAPWPGAEDWWPCCFFPRSGSIRITSTGLARVLRLDITKVHTALASIIARNPKAPKYATNQQILLPQLAPVLRELNLGWSEREIQQAIAQISPDNAYMENGATLEASDEEESSDSSDEEKKEEESPAVSVGVSGATSVVGTMVYPPIMQECMNERIADLKAMACRTMPDEHLRPVLKPLINKRERELVTELTPIITAEEEKRVTEELQREFMEEQKKRKIAKSTTSSVRGGGGVSSSQPNGGFLFNLSFPSASDSLKKLEGWIKK